MYAVHFLLFVMTLVLSHIIQSCLKPYVKHGETDQPPDEPQAEEATTKEDDEDCLWAPWSAWSECTVTCGDGISVRHRVTLILGNCTGDMVQEKICTEQHCPHEKDFIFQRKNDDTDQSSRNEEVTQGPEDVEQDHQYEQTHSDAKPENTDANEVPVSPSGHVSGYKNGPNENVNPENDAHFDENNEQDDDDAPRGRARGQSWTSDDGNAWGHQSSFDSISHGEEPGEEGFRSGGEEKTEDVDNCFSDCSPTDPPADGFGSERSRTEEGAGDKAKSGQDEDQEGARSDKAGEGQGEKFGKGDGDSFKDKEKSKNDKRVKDDGKVSNDEENRHEVDTDFEDDDNFDDEAEDADDYDDDDDNDNDESGSGKKQKREHEEEDAEQEDLEQEEGEEEMKSKRRRKKKRRRKRKPKTRENGTKSNDPQTVCDPTEIGDTFLAKIDSADPALAVSDNEKCDSASKLTSETEDCSTNRSALEVSEIDKCASAKKSTSDLSEETEVCDVTNRL